LTTEQVQRETSALADRGQTWDDSQKVGTLPETAVPSE
jgi:hypothetical protein